LSTNSPDSWAWDLGDGNTASVQNPTNTYGSSGTYTVDLTVTKNSCTNHISKTVDVIELNSSTSQMNVTCNGSNDGSATITVTGGSSYTYLWSNGQTTATAIGLLAGTYYCTATDISGCSIVDTAIVSEPAALIITMSHTDVTCNGVCNGTATANVSGGTPPYFYLWNNSQTTQTATGLCAGNYDVTVTDSSGCTASKSVTISEPTAITVTETITNSTCGNSDGQIDIIVTGGTPSYSYVWSNGDTTTSNTGLAAASYGLTVTDSVGCIYTNTYFVNDIGAPTFTIDSVIDASCNSSCDGAIYTGISGGFLPYSFEWNNTAITQNITGLCAGNYTGTVTDSVGCIAIVSGIVNEPAVLSVVMSSTDDNGTGNGTATAAVSGGTSPYSYLWNDSASQITSTAINLYADTYGVTITDANGCNISDTVVVNLNVGIGNSTQNVYLKIFPNPNTGNFIVEYSGIMNENIKLEIFNIEGQILYKTILSKQNKKRKEIHLKNVSPGVYFLKISNKVVYKIEKIIVN